MLPKLQLEISKLDIDVSSLRSSVEKKANEQQALMNELETIEKNQQHCSELEVGMDERTKK